MEERKFIKLKKEEFGIKEYIKRNLGKGKISRLDIEYTPVGEKIIIHTSKPGLVIGRKGENIQELTRVLKRRFKLENPHIEISEIENPLFDSQLVADDIALALERMGNLKFKVIAYRKLQEIMNAGALGCELRLTGKLPSDRAKSWRFAEGYLKKAGEPSKEIDRAQATGLTKTGIIGIKVAIMAPDAKIYDKIEIKDGMRAKINSSYSEDSPEEDGPKKETKKKKKERKEKVEEKKEEKTEEKTIEDSKDNLEDSKLSKNDSEEISSGTVNESKSSEEILHDKLEAIEEEHDEIAGHEDGKDDESNGKGAGEESIQDVVNTEISEGGDGTAISVEQEIEEGVSEDDDKAIEDSKRDEEDKVNKDKEGIN
ncbi:30S ribosomal protein S3 [Candidatus Pacearchaeota archaeon]|nr:30S ribosomal protein S3 [Candidatus Pacearchaeota archaeon]